MRLRFTAPLAAALMLSACYQGQRAAIVLSPDPARLECVRNHARSAEVSARLCARALVRSTGEVKGSSSAAPDRLRSDERGRGMIREVVVAIPEPLRAEIRTPFAVRGSMRGTYAGGLKTLAGMRLTDRPLYDAGRWQETAAADLDASRRAHLVVLPKVPLIDIEDVLAMLRGSLD